MKIAYYMPFKPMGHNNPSGDLIIGTELFQFLLGKGADIETFSSFRCRWIYLKPYLWPFLVFEILRVFWVCFKKKPDIWLTYHTYYKAPDIVGPLCSRFFNIPYYIFQGIYSTKRRRRLKTKVGFYLNRQALLHAEIVFSNKKIDHNNLIRLLPSAQVVYIPPGLHPEKFRFDDQLRRVARKKLAAQEKVVILTAAMFRAGVKTEGILQVIKSCRSLRERGFDILLAIVGDGSTADQLKKQASDQLAEHVIFLGRQNREEMHKYYSAADIFAFPGIEESLGMVFLEAQACRLPVVAYSDWGAREAVVDGQTGLLSRAAEEDLFTANLQELVRNEELRRKMGLAAEQYVTRQHDIGWNYNMVWQRLQRIYRGE